MSGRLTSRVAVVTGGMTGIGLAAVEALLNEGAQVAVGARRAGDEDAVAALRARVGDTVLFHALDVRSSQSVETFHNAVAAKLGPVDILVNAAGISTHQLVSEHDEADWIDVIDVNLNGPFRMIRATLPQMKERSWGRIINVASTAARTAVPASAAYCASKTGLLGLSRAVALEGAPHGVTCVTVSPTWVETDMLRESAATLAKRDGLSLEAQIDTFRAASPQHRLVQPQEIAALIAFLCSDAAVSITMEDIQVNAGAFW